MATAEARNEEAERFGHRYWVAERLRELTGRIEDLVVTLGELIELEGLEAWAPAKWVSDPREREQVEGALADFLSTYHERVMVGMGMRWDIGEVKKAAASLEEALDSVGRGRGNS